MLVLMFAGIGGGIMTSAIASTWFGLVGSLALAPLGGSLAALAAAVLVALRRSEDSRDLDDLLDISTEQQIEALTHVAAPDRSLAAPPGEALKGRAA